MAKALNKTEQKMLEDVTRFGAFTYEHGSARGSWAGKSRDFGVRLNNAAEALEARGLIRLIRLGWHTNTGTNGRRCSSGMFRAERIDR